MGLLILPVELLRYIGNMLDTPSQVALTQVCQEVSNIYTPQEKGWLTFKNHCLKLTNDPTIDQSKIGSLKTQLTKYYDILLSKLFNEEIDNNEFKEIAIIAEKFFKYFSLPDIRAFLAGFLPSISGDLRTRFVKLAEFNLPFCISLVLALTKEELNQYGLENHDFLLNRFPLAQHKEAKDFFSSVQDWRSSITEEASVLHHALLAGCQHVLFALLNASPDSINVPNRQGKTLLICACEMDDIDLAKELLQRGAQINLQDGRGCTALFHTVARDNNDLLDVLLKQEAIDVDVQGMNGLTALMYAVFLVHLRMVNPLIDRGANVNFQTEQQQTPLMMSVYSDTEDAQSNCIAIINTLLERGADINRQDEDGLTALMHAVTQRRLDIAELLLAHGADKTIKNKENQTAMDLAQQSGDEALLKLLRGS
jgi:ankyrin repeat protein